MSEEDAEELDQDEDEDGEEVKKKSFLSKKLIFIVAGVLVLIGGAGGGAYFLGFLGGGNERELASAAAPEVIDPPVFFDLPDMTVNLAGSRERSQYLRMEISIEVADKATLDVVKPFLPRVIDTFQVYLRELRSADLEGSAGIYRLKEELLRRVNLAVHPAKIDDVLFRKLLVQ
ncbi:MAG: flagellar basal body-associated FliL family protein [Fimbriimonadaceae bacterium]|nr:flagellar basal body-associated FliL family protein [Alphaproteobacteria bacterium]